MKKRLFLFSSALVILLAACSKTDVGNAAQNNLNNRSVGASANDFLSAAKYQSINLEIQYMPGYAPDGPALNNLVSFLGSLLNKPGGVNITERQVEASGKTSFLLTDISAFESSHRTVFTSGNALGVYLLFVDAAYTEASTLGLAYRNTSMAVFGKTIQNNSGGLNQPTRTKLESITTEHEFGHLLGLVNLGSPMQVNHKDPNSNHCNNSACLMYFSTNVGGGVLISGPIPTLDDNCRNDLRANGGK